MHCSPRALRTGRRPVPPGDAMSDLCPRCGNSWLAHNFEVDENDGPIAYILTDDGERIVCRTKVKVEVVS